MKRESSGNIIDINSRIRASFALLLFVGVLIGVRLFFLQIVSADYYKTQASRQQNFSQAIEPRRGDIYLRERNGDLIPLASVKDGYLLYIKPALIENPEEIYRKISDIVPLEKNDFMTRAAKKDDPYEIVLHKIERGEAEKIRDLKINGLGLEPEEWRSYPAKTLASHVVGFLGYKGDSLEGRYGLEREFENELKGYSGYQRGLQSAGGILIDFGKSIFAPPEEGYDVILTIEPNVQAFLEHKLTEIKEEWDPEKGGGIILEPKTGKIIAMAAFPNFDPNSYGEEKTLDVFINPLVENVFEFGSVFKPLTVAAGLNEKVITPDTTYFDNGYLVLDGYTIKNFDEKGRGKTTIQKVLEESLNTGAAFVASQLGKEKMREYFLRYRFGSETGVTLPGEVSGNISNLYSKRDVEYATASFGQGISATPLAFAQASAALANGGKIMKPYLVERIIRPGKEDLVTNPEEIAQILDPETSETISRMLTKVADEALLGGSAKFKNWTASAKTGTAQIPLKNGRGYSDEFLHSFLAYAPSFDSRFLLFIYIEKPKGVRYASQSLGPFYKEIMQFLLTYYEVPPDR